MAKLGVERRLGGRVRDLRRARGGLTQEEVAERAGIAANYVSAIERGTKSPTIETLSRVAAALDVSLSELFLDVDRPLPREARRLEAALAALPTEDQRSLLAIVDGVLRLRRARR